MITIVVGGVIVAFLAVLVVGLVTGRIDWRQQGCCPADPDDDLRMRSHETPTTTRRREP